MEGDNGGWKCGQYLAVSRRVRWRSELGSRHRLLRDRLEASMMVAEQTFRENNVD